MGKIITRSTDGEKKKGTINIENLQDFCFFLYLIATTAHQTGEGFDALLIRLTFVLFLGVSVVQMLITHYFKWTGLAAWFLIFILYGYLSVLWAIDTQYISAYSNTFIQMLGCIICISNRIKKSEDIDTYLKMIVYSLVYSAFYLFIVTPSDAFGTERIGSAMGLHSNEVGFRFAIGVIITLYFAFSKKKIGYYLPLVLFVVVAMLSGSRKGIIMCVIALALYPVVSTLNKKSANDIAKLLLRTVIVITIVAVIIYIVMNVNFFYNVIGIRIETMFEAWGGNESADASVSERQFFVNKAKELFKNNPIIGCGMNNFKAYMSEINYSKIAYSHNNYLEILSTLGVIGFAIYYYMMGFMIIKTLGLFFKKNEHYIMNTLTLLVLLLIAFVSYWSINYQSEYVIILYALIYMNIRLQINKRDSIQDSVV